MREIKWKYKFIDFYRVAEKMSGEGKSPVYRPRKRTAAITSTDVESLDSIERNEHSKFA